MNTLIKLLCASNRYLNHLGKLVDAMHILNGTCISETQRKKAKKLLNSFVDEFEDLYGEMNMVYI